MTEKTSSTICTTFCEHQIYYAAFLFKKKEEEKSIFNIITMEYIYIFFLPTVEHNSIKIRFKILRKDKQLFYQDYYCFRGLYLPS